MNKTPSLTYRLSAYEGPLDLLYRLIQSRKIDICDIPIAELAAQYLDFLDKAEDKDMESMSEFTLLAATLLEIKSRMLLPAGDEKDEDPRQQLVDSLLEYKRAKLVAELFSSLETENDGFFFKPPETELMNDLKPKETIDEVLEGVTPFTLYRIFREVMGKKDLKMDRIRSSFKSVRKDTFTIEEKTAFILGLLRSKKMLSLADLFRRCASRMEGVVTFLAVLELIKGKEILARQKRLFGDIEIRKCVE